MRSLARQRSFLGTITPRSTHQASAALACCRYRLNCSSRGGNPYAATKYIGEAHVQAGVTAGSTAVALDDATVAFRLADARVYTAVEKVRLRIEHGEFVAIVGPTGCGKSTLLNVAAGLLRPSSGTVRIFDSPLAGLNRQAGYLFQADALFPWKTAIDNVAIGLEVSGVPRAAALQRAQAWLTSVGLAAFGNRYPHMLSGGLRGRGGAGQGLEGGPQRQQGRAPCGPVHYQNKT